MSKISSLDELLRVINPDKKDNEDLNSSIVYKAFDPSVGVAPDDPTQKAIDNILYDFNGGLRIKTPEFGGPWRIVFRDNKSNVLFFNEVVSPNSNFAYSKKYFIEYKLEIYRENSAEPDFVEVLNLKDKDVLLYFPMESPGLGDAIAWFSAIPRFIKKHKCKAHVILTYPELEELFKPAYPDIDFLDYESSFEIEAYASYYIGVYFDKEDKDNAPFYYKSISLADVSSYMLGLSSDNVNPPKIFIPKTERIIPEPYVCIATQSTKQCKYWNNKKGWSEVIDVLKLCGYRVIDIDQKNVVAESGMINIIPKEAENFSGETPLIERAKLLKDADFFIGLSSGLSWLAWACNIPVVLISGFTHPLNEFYTPYRVINPLVCNSCWNDWDVKYDLKDFLWCPYYKNTEHMFECTVNITSKQVLNVIEQIPSFHNQVRKPEIIDSLNKLVGKE